MTVEEAKRERLNLERKILGLLTTFHSNTGMRVRQINITLHEIRGNLTNEIVETIHEVETEVEL